MLSEGSQGCAGRPIVTSASPEKRELPEEGKVIGARPSGEVVTALGNQLSPRLDRGPLPRGCSQNRLPLGGFEFRLFGDVMACVEALSSTRCRRL